LAPFYAKALQGGKTEFENRYKDDCYRQQVVPVRDDQGAIVAGMVISHNITERRLAQEALSEANESLERRGARGTRAPVEAPQPAEAANVGKSRLPANKKQRIRTPVKAHNRLCFPVPPPGGNPRPAADRATRECGWTGSWRRTSLDGLPPSGRAVSGAAMARRGGARGGLRVARCGARMARNKAGGYAPVLPRGATFGAKGAEKRQH